MTCAVEQDLRRYYREQEKEEDYTQLVYDVVDELLEDVPEEIVDMLEGNTEFYTKLYARAEEIIKEREDEF